MQATMVFGFVLLTSAALPLEAATATRVLAEMNLEELMQIEVQTVVGASKHEQKISQAPSAVTIVTKDDIRKFGYRTLADILRGVRGFYISNDRSYGYIGVRGFNRPGDYGGRILILIDGHRVNEPIYDSATNQTDLPLDVDLIDRVEIIRGPGQALYGNNAVLAVINIITRRGRDFHGPEVSAGAGSFETYQERLGYGGVRSNGLEAVVSGTWYDSEGDRRLYFRDFDAPVTNNGIAENADHGRMFNVFTNLRYRDFSLEGAYVERVKQVPSGLYGTVFNDPRHEYTDSHSFVQLQYEHAFPAVVDVLTRVFYHRYKFDGRYPFDAAAPSDPPEVVMNRDDQIAQSVGGELQLRRTFFKNHALTAGVEYRNDYEIKLNNYDVDPVTVYQDTTMSAASASVYAQDEYQVFRRLILNLGLRLDHFSTFGDTVNPRLAAIYNPWETTTLKFVYGTGFRAPNAYERSYASTYHAANVDLRPEKVTSYELIWEQDVGKHLRTSVLGFQLDAKDLIGLTTDSSGNDLFDNIDSATVLGAEFEIEGRWANDVRARAGYTFARTEDDLTGRRLDNSPQHLSKLSLTAPLYSDKVYIGAETQYTSSRNTVNGVRLPGFFIANLTLLSRKFWNGLEVSGAMYNVFDRKFSDPGDGAPDTIPQDGRTMQLKLVANF